MAYRAYQKGLIDCSAAVKPDNLKDKSVVVTGGAKGMGEEGVRAFVKAGAFVTFGDIDQKAGRQLETECAPNAKFIPCDVTSWEDQLAVFRFAAANSPRKTIDIVVANAGIGGADELFSIENTDEPAKPQLKTVKVNLLGTMYTVKLARHYFMKHPLDAEHDRCLILNASLTGFIDAPGIPQYIASKWGLRGLMRSMRRTTALDGIRINLTGPWYVATALLSPPIQEYCRSKGVVFAEAGDAAAAWLKISSDPNINGRSFGIVPRDYAPQGYYDLGKDDYEDGEYLDKLQDILMQTAHRLGGKSQI